MSAQNKEQKKRAKFVDSGRGTIISHPIVQWAKAFPCKITRFAACLLKFPTDCFASDSVSQHHGNTVACAHPSLKKSYIYLLGMGLGCGLTSDAKLLLPFAPVAIEAAVSSTISMSHVGGSSMALKRSIWFSLSHHLIRSSSSACLASHTTTQPVHPKTETANGQRFRFHHVSSRRCAKRTGARIYIVT